VLDFPTSPRAIGKKNNYLKMKDLLSKNHDDKVRDYLHKMEGQSLDEIVNGGHFFSPRKQNTDAIHSKIPATIVEPVKNKSLALL
jgi:hypothetical protein